MQSSCQSQSWYLDPKTYPRTCAMKSFFISSRSAPSVVTPVFLYSSPPQRRSQTSQHKLWLFWKVDLFPHWQDHRIHNELLQINKINCNFWQLSCSHIWIVVQSLSYVQLCDPMDCSTPGFPVSHYLQSLLKLMSIESLMPSNYPILCSPILFLPSVFPSISDFSSDLAFHMRKAKYWSFIFSLSPSNEYSGLISFRIDWLDLLAFQGMVGWNHWLNGLE